MVFGLQGTVILAAAAVGAVLVACLGAILRRVGGFLFMWGLTAGVLEWILAPGTVPFHLICLGVGLVIAVITAILMDPIIIVLSSIGGGIMAGLAVAALPGLDLNILLTYGICACHPGHSRAVYDEVQRSGQEGKTLFRVCERGEVGGDGSGEGEDAAGG